MEALTLGLWESPHRATQRPRRGSPVSGCRSLASLRVFPGQDSRGLALSREPFSWQHVCLCEQAGPVPAWPWPVRVSEAPAVAPAQTRPPYSQAHGVLGLWTVRVCVRVHGPLGVRACVCGHIVPGTSLARPRDTPWRSGCESSLPEANVDDLVRENQVQPAGSEAEVSGSLSAGPV